MFCCRGQDNKQDAFIVIVNLTNLLSIAKWLNNVRLPNLILWAS